MTGILVAPLKTTALTLCEKSIIREIIPREVNNNTMGIMLDDTINMGKRPLHDSLEINMQPVRSSATAATGKMTATAADNNKRGKVFPSFFLPPPSSVVDPTGYAICRECPTGIADALPYEQQEPEAEEESPPPFRTLISVGDMDAGDEVAAPSAQASSRPTADDYANLFFCESSEEEEARANLLAAAEPTTTTETTAETMAAAATASTTARKKKRRRVSFGASIPAVHLLDDTPPSSAITPEERSASWFSRSDLEMLKSSAQLCVQEMRNRIQNDGGCVRDRSAFRSAMVRMEIETNSSIRGLEHRVFRRKQQRKALIRDVLECQAHIKGLAKFGHEMGWEEGTKLLAKASRERSTKARQVAFVDARDDYVEVYGDDDASEDVDAQIRKRQKKHSRLVSLQEAYS